MQTDQIKKILTEVGITEQTSTVGAWDSEDGIYDIEIYDYIVQAIEMFMNQLEKKQNDNKTTIFN